MHLSNSTQFDGATRQSISSFIKELLCSRWHRQTHIDHSSSSSRSIAIRSNSNPSRVARVTHRIEEGKFRAEESPSDWGNRSQVVRQNQYWWNDIHCNDPGRISCVKDYYHPSSACVSYSRSPNGVRAASYGGAVKKKKNKIKCWKRSSNRVNNCLRVNKKGKAVINASPNHNLNSLWETASFKRRGVVENVERTRTSFKSLLCKWCSGSRKFCLTLSSREYLTSANCFIDSPASTSAAAETV